MDIEKINRWLTLGANVGVLAGILFLAVEIRQNNQILVEQARHSMLENQKEWAFVSAGDRDITRLMYPPPTSEPLDVIDQQRRADLVVTMLLTWQWEFEQSRSELFGESRLPVAGYRMYWRAMQAEEIWVDYRHVFSPEFVQFIEEEILGSSQ